MSEAAARLLAAEDGGNSASEKGIALREPSPSKHTSTLRPEDADDRSSAHTAEIPSDSKGEKHQLVKFIRLSQRPNERADQTGTHTAAERADQESQRSVPISGQSEEARHRHCRNMFFLCAGFFFNFVAFQAEQNLQSSLNSAGGSGVLSMSVLYATVALTALFLAPAALRSIGPRKALLLAEVAFGLFTIANIVGNSYFLLISAGCVGVAAGLLWPSQFKILTNTASAYAEVMGRQREEMIARFNGIFFSVFVSTNIPGNLVSSLLLSAHSSKRDGICSPGRDTTVAVSTSQRQALMAVFVVCDMVSFVMFFCMRPYSHRGWTDTETLHEQAALAVMKESALATLRLLRVTDMLLLVPINLTIGFLKAFVYGDFNQYFVSQCLGIGQVGFVMVCFGVSNAIGNLSSSKIAEKTSRPAVILTGMTLALGLLVFLLSWAREPNMPLLFVLGTLWGVVDSCWNQQLSALFGVVFRGLKQESSYANLTLWQAAGFSLSFAFSRRFHGCLAGIHLKMWLLIAMLPLGVFLYLCVEWRVRRRRKTYHINGDNMDS